MASELRLLINQHTPLRLTDQDYLAQGGEGSIYIHDQLACKIYHEPARMIPLQKVEELRQIGIEHVIAPQDLLFDEASGQPLGYTMKYLPQTDYLCRLFVKNFRVDHQVSPDMISALVKKLQETLIALHRRQIIVADYHELNFLVDPKFSIPYHIDVDSYQTPHFPGTAIMESVRDRTVPYGTFTELTDWFSWAVVTFQLYTGIHPYKGHHPAYKPSDLDGRMQAGISVFDPAVKIPESCRDFSIIPLPHREWYRQVFSHQERSIPPLPDRISLSLNRPSFNPDSVQSGLTGGLKASFVHDFAEPIISLWQWEQSIYVITSTGLYRDQQRIMTWPADGRQTLLAKVEHEEPVVLWRAGNLVRSLNLAGEEIDQFRADEMMAANGMIYRLDEKCLMEHSFVRLGQVKHCTRVVAPCAPYARRLFPGVLVEDIFGKTRLTLPFARRRCASLWVPELDGLRIIAARREGVFCAINAVRAGKYCQYRLHFSSDFRRYDVGIEPDRGQDGLNFIVRSDGLGVAAYDSQSLELFYDWHGKRKEVLKSPVQSQMPLWAGLESIFFADSGRLYTLTGQG